MTLLGLITLAALSALIALATPRPQVRRCRVPVTPPQGPPAARR